MNELFLCTQFIIEGLKENPLVHTTSFEKTSDIDMNKANIYPLANVDIIDSFRIEGMLYFNYLITILTDRDIKNDLNNDKVFGSNLIDNLNEAHGIATRLLNHIEGNPDNVNDVEVATVSNIQMLKATETNILDGVRFTLQLEIPNTTGC